MAHLELVDVPIKNGDFLQLCLLNYQSVHSIWFHQFSWQAWQRKLPHERANAKICFPFQKKTRRVQQDTQRSIHKKQLKCRNYGEPKNTFFFMDTWSVYKVVSPA